MVFRLGVGVDQSANVNAPIPSQITPQEVQEQNNRQLLTGK